MPVFKKVPLYVLAGTTTAQMAAAEAMYARLQQNSAYDMTKGPRRAAVCAKFQCSLPLTPLEAVEFAAIVPQGYLSRVEMYAQETASRGLEQREAREQWEREERSRKEEEAQRKCRSESITDVRVAQGTLAPLDYMNWLQTPQGQRAAARMNF